MKFRIIIALLAVVMGLVYSCQSESEIEYMRYYTAGQELYKTRCQNCHGANGEGLAALIPPLTDAAFLQANKSKLACYVQNGLQQPIMVNSKPFSGNMPPSGLAHMEIAEVLTFVQNSFGNKLGLHNIEQVNKELKACE